MTRKDRRSTPAEVWVIEGDRATQMPDELATEEPLEIRLATKDGAQPVAVTMRTPGSDPELAVGFLYAEGILRDRSDVRGVHSTASRAAGEPGHVLTIEIDPELAPDFARLDRHFYTTSACGLCGKGSLDALLLDQDPDVPEGPKVSPETLHALPATLRQAQGVFRSTGGLHAAALFTADGELVAAREDVGRHNALDKLLGWAFLEDRLPWHDHVVLLSGRASYELLQKNLMAETPIVCAVSAPSSLAVALARRFGVTLVGFLREGRFNVYSGRERIRT